MDDTLSETDQYWQRIGGWACDWITWTGPEEKGKNPPPPSDAFMRRLHAEVAAELKQGDFPPTPPYREG
jgi:hypothetical protein